MGEGVGVGVGVGDGVDVGVGEGVGVGVGEGEGVLVGAAVAALVLAGVCAEKEPRAQANPPNSARTIKMHTYMRRYRKFFTAFSIRSFYKVLDTSTIFL